MGKSWRGDLPLSELTIFVLVMVTPFTTLLDRPPTEPMETPCPPC